MEAKIKLLMCRHSLKHTLQHMVNNGRENNQFEGANLTLNSQINWTTTNHFLRF